MSRESWSAEVAVGSARGSDSVTQLGPYMGLRRGFQVLEAEMGRRDTGEEMLKVCGKLHFPRLLSRVLESSREDMAG